MCERVRLRMCVCSMIPEFVCILNGKDKLIFELGLPREMHANVCVGI